MGIWNALFGNNEDSDDEDQNERSWVGSQCKEGVDHRSHSLFGWGDENRDHDEDEHHSSWGDGWKFWGDSNQSEDIKVKKRD